MTEKLNNYLDFYVKEIVPETSAGNCDLGFDATQFLSNPIPAGCNDGVNTEGKIS